MAHLFCYAGNSSITAPLSPWWVTKQGKKRKTKQQAPVLSHIWSPVAGCAVSSKHKTLSYPSMHGCYTGALKNLFCPCPMEEPIYTRSLDFVHAFHIIRSWTCNSIHCIYFYGEIEEILMTGSHRVQQVSWHNSNLQIIYQDIRLSGYSNIDVNHMHIKNMRWLLTL